MIEWGRKSVGGWLLRGCDSAEDGLLNGHPVQVLIFAPVLNCKIRSVHRIPGLGRFRYNATAGWFRLEPLRDVSACPRASCVCVVSRGRGYRGGGRRSFYFGIDRITGVYEPNEPTAAKRRK